MRRTTRFWLAHPFKAAAAFWKGFSSSDPLGDSITAEQSRLQVLRTAIGLYKLTLGSFPARLEDLPFNAHNVPDWGSGYIHWRGPDTFLDSFGHPYQYSCDGEGYTLKSPGLDEALASQQENK